jgi:hypothetical protein
MALKFSTWSSAALTGAMFVVGFYSATQEYASNSRVLLPYWYLRTAVWLLTMLSLSSFFTVLSLRQK